MAVDGAQQQNGQPRQNGQVRQRQAGGPANGHAAPPRDIPQLDMREAWLGGLYGGHYFLLYLFLATYLVLLGAYSYLESNGVMK